MERFLSIHLTDLCNSSCTFCVVASPLYTKDTVQYEDIIHFLRSNAGQGWASVNLHGGEPTIHPRFIEILQTIRNLAYPEVLLQTNGIRLADAEFASKIVDLGVTKFIVSLHGDTPEMHDSQTGTPGGFIRTIQGIRNVKARYAHVRTNTVITRQNLSRLSEICRFACELGVDHVNLSNMHPVGSALFARSTCMPTFNEMQEAIYRAVDMTVSYGRILTLEGFPYCVIQGRMDHQLNNETREIRMLMRGQVIEHYDNFMSEVMRIFGPPCLNCALKQKCGGVYPQYIQYNGWGEFSPLMDISSPVSVAAQLHSHGD